jgi:hypothetical protein
MIIEKGEKRKDFFSSFFNSNIENFSFLKVKKLVKRAMWYDK